MFFVSRAQTMTLVSALAFLIPAQSFAEWSYRESKSEFDGAISKGIWAAADDGKSALVIWGHPDRGVIAVDAPRIVLVPSLDYICTTDETDMVEYITLDSAGNKLEKRYAGFRIDDDRKAMRVQNSDTAALADGSRLFQAMMSAAEIRFRVTDDCGKEEVMKFSLADFKQALSKIGAN